MPFHSKRQQRLCYALKGQGQNGSWDCGEWAAETNFAKLPEKKRKPRAPKIMKVAVEKRADAVHYVNHYLEHLSRLVPVEKQANFQTLQDQLDAGDSLEDALRTIHPNDTPQQLAALVQRVASGAASFCGLV